MLKSAVLPLIMLGQALRWFFSELTGWWPRASFAHLLQGLPAVAVVLLTALPLVLGRGKDTVHYEEAGLEALDSGDFEKADFCFRAVVDQKPDNEEFRYQLALAAEKVGDLERANAIMSLLSKTTEKELKALAQAISTGNRERVNAIMTELDEVTEPGYPSSNLWLARHLLQARRSIQANVMAEYHLKRAIQASPEYADAHQELGMMYMLNGRIKEAEPHLLKAAEGRPELWINVARMRVLEGNQNQARLDAQKALDYYRSRAESNLDDVQSRLFWAESLVFLEHFDAAAAVLIDGMKYVVDPRLPQAVSRVYLMWAEVLRAHPGTSNASHQQVLLSRSFQFNPRNPMLLRRLIAGLKDNGADGRLIRPIVRGLLSRGQDLAILNVLLAIEADAHDRRTAADDYLVKARKIDPKIVATAAELALSFVEMEPPQLGEASYLVAVALREWPQDADLLFASGYISYRRGLWPKALFDLEAALPKKSRSVTIHRLLADVCEHLGMDERAQEHLALTNSVH